MIVPVQAVTVFWDSSWWLEVKILAGVGTLVVVGHELDQVEDLLQLDDVDQVWVCQDRQEFLTRWKKKQEFVAVNLYFDIGDGRLKLYKNKIHLEIYNFLQNQ